jgi:hypothetical protein
MLGVFGRFDNGARRRARHREPVAGLPDGFRRQCNAVKVGSSAVCQAAWEDGGFAVVGGCARGLAGGWAGSL